MGDHVLGPTRVRAQREELWQATQAGKLAEFVSALAHEISQPLTAILSYAQAGRRMLGDREPQLHTILQYIVEDDQRAAEIIQRSRSLLKKGEPATRAQDINELVEHMVTLVAPDAEARHAMIKTRLAGDLPLTVLDSRQIKQVMLNLISNGFDAMENNRESRELLITTARNDNNTVTVAVRDSGSGIPAEYLPRLFTHFFTSKPDGFGMGLSISRSIVEAHGGELKGANNTDRGATFSFTLPFDPKGDK